ncbi:hypothetical protein NPX13_g8310 [Xylaria arbuscula]|uniref:Uncharacterized protein n=1 Tax=Xylaria arbuscula TaxID=114810 RepID=A0A9W8N8Z4_9PEZI|nr:hypothetical protein NPX13_g8310 [Xylaria arbuscula]
MRLQLISLALTLGTLAWTDSAQQDSLVGYETISLQLRREPGLTTGVAALERRSQTHYKREDCDQKYKKWEWHPPWLHRRKGGGNDDGEDDDDCKCKDNEGEDIPCPSNPLSIPFITPVITTVITTEIVAPTTPSTIPPSSTTVSNSLLASSGTTSEPSSTSATAAEDQQDNDSHHGNDKNKGGDDNWKVIRATRPHE